MTVSSYSGGFINWNKLVIIELILYQLIRYLQVNETQSDCTGASLGGGNVKCWGCFSSSCLYRRKHHRKSVWWYFRKKLFESIKKVEEWIMQQDNDPKHWTHIGWKKKRLNWLNGRHFLRIWIYVRRDGKKEKPKNQTIFTWGLAQMSQRSCSIPCWMKSFGWMDIHM